MARPRKITKEVVGKLELAFSRGLNITEACDFVGLSRDTYYEKLKNDKGFSDKMSRAQNHLISSAKINIAAGIESGDIDLSKWYLERKCKDEYSVKRDIDAKITADVNNNNPFKDLTTDELRKLIKDE